MAFQAQLDGVAPWIQRKIGVGFPGLFLAVQHDGRAFRIGAHLDYALSLRDAAQHAAEEAAHALLLLERGGVGEGFAGAQVGGGGGILEALLAEHQRVLPRRHRKPRGRGLAGLGAVQKDLRARRIALAEPSTVPAGIYARKYLQNIKLWDRIQPKVIPTENVRAALAAVEAGNADAAIVYKTDVSKKVRLAYEITEPEAPTISYAFAVTTQAENPEAAARFLEYLASKPATDVFKRHGFIIKESGRPARNGRASRPATNSR